MARKYTTVGEVVARMGGESRFATLTGFPSSADPDAIEAMDTANAFAVGKMESFVGTRYSVPLDDPLPPVLHEAVLALEVEHLTRSSDRRPAVIKENADAAIADLEKIQRGQMSIVDADPLTPGGQPTVDAYFQAPPRIFDFDNPRSEAARRMKKI